MSTKGSGKEGALHCLLCEKQLTMFSRLRSESFCSADHRDAFFESYQRLALERLRVSLKRLKARRASLIPALEDADVLLLNEPASSAASKAENRPFPKRSPSSDRTRLGAAWKTAADAV